MKTNQVVLIYGFPATGKYTMAKKLEEGGAKLLDNHYFHDFVRPFIKAADDEKVEYFEKMSKLRGAFFDMIRKFYPKDRLVRYVFTSILVQGDEAELKNLTSLAEDINGEFIPIELIANPDVLKQRCQTEYRRGRGKLSDPGKLEKLFERYVHMDVEHPNKLTIDVSDLTEEETFQRIEKHLAKVSK
ncbi:MAG: hypothetical protein FWG18_00025 [Alphaproteobacteria bacterium]|nr:hypothetical protein [Alphaproteobacteria bacterium]